MSGFETPEYTEKIPEEQDVAKEADQIKEILDRPCKYLSNELSERMYEHFHTDSENPDDYFQKNGVVLYAKGKPISKKTPEVIVDRWLELDSVRKIPYIAKKVILEPVTETNPRWKKMDKEEKIQYLKDIQRVKEVLDKQTKVQYQSMSEVFDDLMKLLPILMQTFGDRLNNEFEKQTGQKIDPAKIAMMRRVFEVFLSD